MMPSSTTPDFLVIGAGVVGISIARELAARHPGASVTVLEKEPDIGAHASGRNSGVIHAGFYYTADSLKARFTREGNAALKAFCAERGLPVRSCGKLVVAKNEAEVPVLDTLLARGKQNGVELSRITSREARAIEPRVKTCGAALFSPTTASIDPLQVLRAMAAAAREAGVAIETGVRYLGRSGCDVRTSAATYAPGYVVNAAGLHADTIAKDFGFSRNYHLLPFKGLYLYAAPDAPPLATHIYPVPNLANPFLGVHFTLTVDGKVKIGPTAIPCFWREQYGWLSNFDFGECREIVGRELSLFAGADFDFRRLAAEELRKQFRPYIVGLAGELATGVRVSDYRKWGRPGIRAQLVDAARRKLVMDFVIEGDARSLHVLNAVSPAFTCSIPFARHVADRIEAASR
ncbi:FAD dependent oxidoreductase [Solidesulfovibrio fructosivorans JJ]]|uniref:FAD dependent oxidoreductase n=1 Tax=Solidesulfovibrio fructosivorans JJ] TaxID=596151 RepID=E1JYC4_SOLFR|nr:L-2-hydroxyglutarate oxidase [Solidesulfovibrio fructosivorans]EFL50698.1 FAD dependent oxidoreductase [Solidesulfovibrio fructosivorans JJ]]